MKQIPISKGLLISAVSGLVLATIIMFAATQILAEPATLDSNFSELEQRRVSTEASQATDPLDAVLKQIIAEQGLTGDPSLGRDIPSIEDPVAQLGMKLFFTQALGGDMDSACVSCHLPALGGGDGLPLSIGVGAPDPSLIGPGRTHPEMEFTVPRNAPTTFNIALWDKSIFHDGRLQALDGAPGLNGGGEGGIRTPDVAFGQVDPMSGSNLAMAQARFPTTSPEEMRGFDFAAKESNQDCREHLAARLGDYGNGAGELDPNLWIEEFEAAFGPADNPEDLINEQRFAFAIGQYERSQTFVDTPWKAYVEGDLGALSDSAKRGAVLFFNPIEAGGANCADCHSGDFFTDEDFHVLAIPQIGRGKGDGLTRSDDFGRFRETRQLKDLYAFRTPSLINVTVTGPWGHDGAYDTLEGMVRHHLNPAEAIRTYDWDALSEYVATEYAGVNTQKALARLEFNRREGIDSIENVDLTDAEVADILAFIGALTDPCVTDEACLSPWMPAEDDLDPDGERLEIYLAVSSQ